MAQYYRPLFQFLDHMAEQRFLKAEHLASLIRTREPHDLLRQLRSYTPVRVDKWLDRKPSRLI